MKILKAGTIPEVKEPIYHGTCLNCHCQVEVTERETHLGTGRASATRYVKCPTELCAFEIRLDPYITRDTVVHVDPTLPDPRIAGLRRA